MKSLQKLFLVVAAAVALTLALSAQQQPATSNQSNQGMQGMQGMQEMQSGQMQHGNMNQMMQNCRNTAQPMMRTNSQAKKEIEAAKASNDPAKMRSALDEAEKAIDGMNAHMSSCMSMMNMMQNMHGMMGGGMMGGQNGTSANRPNSKDRELCQRC